MTAPRPEPMRVPGARVSAWNAANALTGLRLVLVPVFAVLLLHDGGRSSSWRVAACVVFGVAAVTDLVDGEVARKWGQVTDVGKIADPIADKALTGTALLGLSSLGMLPWVVTLMILVREVGVTLLRFWVIRHGVLPASRGGKLKTLLQGLAIGLFLLPLSGTVLLLAQAVMALAVVVTVATGVDYVSRALRLRRTSERAQRKRAARAARAR